MSYILNDDFDGGTWVDSSGNTHSGSSGVANTLPSSAIWTVQTGAPSDYGSGSLMQYVSNTSVIYQDGDSNLVIAMGKQGTDGAGSGNWPAGACTTGNSASELGGSGAKYVVAPGQSCEVRAIVNPLQGCWPAIWFEAADGTYGTGTYAEIDMQESGDSNPNVSTETIWGGANGNQYRFSASTPSFTLANNTYHVYRLDLYENELEVYIDGALNYSLTAAQAASNWAAGGGPSPAPAWPFNASTGWQVILNVATSSQYSGGQPAAGSLPHESMLVDYVRIWSPTGPDPNSGNGTSTGSVALAPMAMSGAVSVTSSGNNTAVASAALSPMAIAGIVNTGTGGGGGGSVISLMDAFGSNDIATTWANSYGTYSVNNGYASIQADTTYSSGLVSTNTYSLTGSSVFGQFLPYIAPSGSMSLQIYLDANDTFQFGYSDGDMFAYIVQGGVQTATGPFGTAYDPIQHAWWRIREQTGIVYFDTAPDGATWTTFWSTAYTMAVTAVYVYVVAGDNASDPTGTAYVTNINTAPAAMASFVDGFDSNDLSTNWAWSYGTYSVANSECSIQCDTSFDTGIITSVTYNLQSSYVAAEMLPYIAGSAETALQVFQAIGSKTGETCCAEIEYTGGNIQASIYQGGTLTYGPAVTYNATNHAWWRIREASGTLYFETSPNSLTWTQVWSTVYTFSVSSLTIQIYAGDYGTDATGTSYVTNVNVPVTTSAGSIAMPGMAIAGATGAATTSTGSVALAPMAISGTVPAQTLPFSLVGAPALTRATSGSVTPVFGSGQTDTAGDLLIAIVTAAAATSVTAPSTPTGWTLVTGKGNAATSPHAYVAAYYKIAGGSDVLPAFTSTLSGTGAMTATVYELTSYDDITTSDSGYSDTYSDTYSGDIALAWLDSYGVYASGSSAATLSSMSAATATTTYGPIGIAAFVQEAAAAANTWNNAGSSGFAAFAESAGAAFAHSSSTNSVTSGSFTPTAGALVVALVGVGNGNGIGQSSMTVTDSSGSGSWTLLAEASSVIGAGYAGVWARQAWSGAATVTFTALPSTVLDPCIIVRQFTGAAPVTSQPGQTATVFNTSNQALSITPLQTGSQVVGGFGTSSATKTLTANGTTSIYGQYDGGSGGDTEACIEATTSSTAGTPISLGFTNAAADNAFALVEILANSVNDGATSSVSHTAIDVTTATGATRQSNERTVTDTGHWTTDTSAYGAGLVLVIFGSTTPGSAASTLVDTFVVNDLSTLWSNTFGTVSVSGNEVSIKTDTSYDSGLGSTGYFDIRGTYCYAEFSPYIATSSEVGLQLYNDAGNLAVIEYAGGNMTAYITEAGVAITDPSPVTYNATNHAWWQISESSGTLYFQTAPDGQTWTTLWSTAYTFDASDMEISVFAGDYGSDPAGTSHVANFNTTGTSTTSGSVALAPMAMSGAVSVTTAGAFNATGSVALAPMVLAATGSNFSGTNVTGSMALAPFVIQATGAVVLPTTLFPIAPLDIFVELYVNGAWTDITSYCYQRDPITITRGRPNEASTISPGQMTITLNNRDGRFSPRNPSGPYYGTLTRNTQLRLSAPTDVLQEQVLAYRFWGEVPAWPPQWDQTGSDVYVQVAVSGIMRRLTQSGQTALGSALYLYYSSLPDATAPAAYWTLEDASGSTSFASFVDGVNAMTFTGSPQLSSDTSFGGSLGLPVLNGSTFTGVLGAAAPAAKRSTQQWTSAGTYKWTCPADVYEVTAFGTGGGGGGQGGGSAAGRPGGGGGESAIDLIGVTPTVRYTIAVGAGGGGGAAGAGSGGSGGSTYMDGDTRVLTANGGTGASGDNEARGGGGSTNTYHFTGGHGGAPGLHIEGTGGGGSGGSNQAGNPGAAANGQGASPGGAAVTGGGKGGASGIGTGNGQAGAKGGSPGGGGGGGGMQANNSGNQGGAGADGQMTLSWTTGSGTSQSASANVLRFLLDVPAAGDTAGVVATMYTSGSVSQVNVEYGATGTLELVGYSNVGASGPATLFDSGALATGVNGTPVLVSAELVQNGANISWALGVAPPGGENVVTYYTGTLTGATVSTVTSVVMNQGGKLQNSAVGHVAVMYTQIPLNEPAYAASGYTGEDAATRFQRLCGMFNVTSEIEGNNSDCVLMGPQTSESLVTLLQECESADLGQLYEPRDFFGLGYRTRVDMQSQTPVCALDYAQAQLASPLAPTDDDQLIANDVTVSQQGGTSFDAIDETGTMSINPPPNGIGDYSKSYTVSLASASQLGSEANWLLAIGTVDQQRFPVINTDLSRTEMAAVFGTVAAVDVGDLITIAHPPAWMPPETIQQLAVGWTETLNAYTWTIDWNAIPALPYFTGVVGDPLFAQCDTDGSELYANITSTATTMLVAPTGSGYPLWTNTASDFPFDVMMAGERITVTNITSATSPQTFTVIRSVNGVVKAQVAGQDVRLFYPTIVSLT